MKVHGSQYSEKFLKERIKETDQILHNHLADFAIMKGLSIEEAAVYFWGKREMWMDKMDELKNGEKS